MKNLITLTIACIIIFTSCKKDNSIKPVEPVTPIVNTTNSTTIQFFRGLGNQTIATDRVYTITKYTSTGGVVIVSDTLENFPTVLDVNSACSSTGTSISFENGCDYVIDFTFKLNGVENHTEYDLTITNSGLAIYYVITSDLFSPCQNKLIFRY